MNNLTRFAVVAMLIALASCAVNPVTGERELALINQLEGTQAAMPANFKAKRVAVAGH